MTVVDGATVGSGATGRCGGFINASITHGIANGHARWPDEMPAILDIQRRLWDDTVRLVNDVGVAGVEGVAGAGPIIEPVGKYTVATRPHEVAEVAAAVTMLRSYGEDAEQLNDEEIRRRLGSTSYLGGYHLRSANGLCDPVRLAARLAGLAEEAGATIA
ncbi:MAG: putative FAD-dependent oxidoreductase, partial [Desertimonas sp.]|nr:putative FAD-dependent oxidoreductase [Desertimonas sp.]